MVESNPSSESAPGGRRRALVVLLLTATLTLGAAARLATRPDPTPDRVSSSGGPVAIEAALDRDSVLRGSDGLVRVELVMRGQDQELARGSRVPTDLVVVLDRSGSMNGRPIQTALGAVRELISGLDEGDRFALVSYASGATLDIPLEAAAGATRERWQRVLSTVRASGGTNMSSGLDHAHAILAGSEGAGRAPRLIVLSDGLANQGDHSLAGLRARAARALSGEYVLSAVGIGDGFDETVMSALADAGTGNFYYLPDLTRLAGIFADEFAAARETVARALRVRIEPAVGVRVASAGGYALDRDGDAQSFHPGDLFAGQERRVWIVLHAPTTEAGDLPLGRIAVDYATPDGERHRVALDALPVLACVAGEDDYYASFDADRYRRANLNESLGQLKQSVAKKVAEGRQAEAVAEVEAYRVRNAEEQMRALGYVMKDEADEVDDLRATVAAPSAAEPEERNRLGKALLESGRDAQRAGAKR